MNITFVGDICLGRYVREKFEDSAYQLVTQDLVNRLISQKGKVIANLESPVADDILSDGLRFSGTSVMLSQFKWVNCFSLANNHINDFGERGMAATVQSLKKVGLDYNGLYESEYTPYLIEDGENKIAVITCSYGVNRKIDPSCRYKLLNIREDVLYTVINKYKQLGYFVIVYAHMGIMFCRFPSLQGGKIIENMIDSGCGCVIVSHPHCIGGMYKYKDIPVFYSLGDFLGFLKTLSLRKNDVHSMVKRAKTDKPSIRNGK